MDKTTIVGMDCEVSVTIIALQKNTPFSLDSKNGKSVG